MSTPEIDPTTAQSMEEDADIGAEHTKPTYADEHPEGEDESVPEGHSGMDPD